MIYKLITNTLIINLFPYIFFFFISIQCDYSNKWKAQSVVEPTKKKNENQTWEEVADDVNDKGRMYGTGNALQQFFSFKRNKSKKSLLAGKNMGDRSNASLTAENQELRAQVELLKKYREEALRWREEVERRFSGMPPPTCNQGPPPYPRDPFDDGSSGAPFSTPVHGL